ncbi:MAG: restriction endonuclease subunit S, partial [Gemmatimonadetes bacterium]|nr:restriction endonuclease subunit S [Gemmatimonadota bacterium]
MEWPRLRLEQLLLDARSGTWGSAPDESKSVYPVLRSTNIQDGKLVIDNPALRTLSENTVEKYLLVKGDILVTTSSGSSRLLGKNAIIEELPRNNGKYVFSNFTWRLRPATSHVIPKFLYYYLNSPTARTELERIQSTTSGLRN